MKKRERHRLRRIARVRDRATGIIQMKPTMKKLMSEADAARDRVSRMTKRERHRLRRIHRELIRREIQHDKEVEHVRD